MWRGYLGIQWKIPPSFYLIAFLHTFSDSDKPHSSILSDLSLGWSIWFLNWLSSNLRSKWGDLPVLSPFPLSDLCLFRESLILVSLHQYLHFQGDHSRCHYCLWHSLVFPRIFCTSTSLAVAWSGCKKRNSEVNIVLPDSWHILCVSGRQTGTVLGR